MNGEGIVTESLLPLSALGLKSRLLASLFPSLTRGGWPKAGRGRVLDGFRESDPLPALPISGGGIVTEGLMSLPELGL